MTDEELLQQYDDISRLVNTLRGYNLEAEIAPLLSPCGPITIDGVKLSWETKSQKMYAQEHHNVNHDDVRESVASVLLKYAANSPLRRIIISGLHVDDDDLITVKMATILQFEIDEGLLAQKHGPFWKEKTK